MRGPDPDPVAGLAIRAWNLLGGLDWSGLPQVAHWLGFEDVERLAEMLAQIRESQRGDQ